MFRNIFLISAIVVGSVFCAALEVKAQPSPPPNPEPDLTNVNGVNVPFTGTVQTVCLFGEPTKVDLIAQPSTASTLLQSLNQVTVDFICTGPAEISIEEQATPTTPIIPANLDITYETGYTFSFDDANDVNRVVGSENARQRDYNGVGAEPPASVSTAGFLTRRTGVVSAYIVRNDGGFLPAGQYDLLSRITAVPQ